MRHLWITTLAATAALTTACIPTPVVFVQEAPSDATDAPPPTDPTDDTDVASADTDLDPDEEPDAEPAVAITSLQITPDAAVNDGELSCEATVEVAGGGDALVIYAWYRVASGEVLGVGPTLQLQGTGVMPGDGVACRVFAQTEDGRAEREAFVAITNRAPIIASVMILPDEVTNGSTAICEADAADPDGGDVSLRYVWNNGTTGTTTTVSGLTPGDTLSCGVTATDAFGASATQVASVSVAATPPSAPAVGFAAPVPMADDDLVCSIEDEAIDPDGGTVSYTYSWSLDGMVIPEAGDGSTLTADFLGPADTWTCEATAQDEWGASSEPAQATTRIAPRVIFSELSVFSDVAYLALTYVDASTGAPTVDLGDLAIAVHDPSDGSVARTTAIPSNSFLSPGESFVIVCDASAYASALPDAPIDLDLSGAPCAIDTSGDAALSLVWADEPRAIDRYGEPDVAGLGAMWAYVDAVIRRSIAIDAPTTTFDVSDWDFSADAEDRDPGTWPPSGD